MQPIKLRIKKSGTPHPLALRLPPASLALVSNLGKTCPYGVDLAGSWSRGGYFQNGKPRASQTS